jgi:hypothetical protein
MRHCPPEVIGMRRAIPLVVALAVSATAMAACGGDANDAQATGPTAATAGPTAATASGPTAVSAPSGATGRTADATGPTGSAAELEDGRHFGWIKAIDPSGSMTFDLAYFYTGDEANQVAADRADETPVPNDYYIVNDNPKVRTLAIAPAAEIRVFDWNRCCDRHLTVDLATFADVISNPDGNVEVDGHVYNGQTSPYWITVDHGAVTEIEEQYLP